MEYTIQELEKKGLIKEASSGFITDNNKIDIREAIAPLSFFNYYVNENNQSIPYKAAYKKEFKEWGEQYKYNPKTKKYIVE